MKIGILTQPFHTNYGGLLQAYALQTVLMRMGHQTVFLSRESSRDHIRLLFHRIAFRLFVICLEVRVGAKAYIPTKRERKTIRRYTDLFIKNYLTCSPVLRNTNELKKYTEGNGFDAYIVGSDQVWRPSFSPCLTNYFLDFAINQSVIRIAYAASFGVCDWRFTYDQTTICSSLIKKFDAISVREESGVLLCRDYLGVHADIVLDPTLLLCREDYLELLAESGEENQGGDLFCYILDDSPSAQFLIEKVSSETGYLPFTIMPKRRINNRFNAKFHLEECVFPGVSSWIRSFADAKTVVTDSFHGCVFSIIFNKPFWVIGNEGRGLARFKSLLTLFKLESRFVSEETISRIDINTTIDWEYVNRRISELRIKSLGFLQKHLNSER